MGLNHSREVMLPDALQKLGSKSLMDPGARLGVGFRIIISTINLLRQDSCGNT